MMEYAIRPQVRAMAPALIALRRDLHEHAELSLEERRTQGVILQRLRDLGLEDVRAIADTGVTALVRGAREGPNLLWRADIDGLPLEEETGLAFACTEQRAMHACGHDGHTAIAVGVAGALKANAGDLAGSVRLAFQPAEEHVGGAQRMIAEGIMEAPKVDQVYGLHIWAPLPVGRAGVTAGPIFAAATHFRIIIRGRGGHASAPHQTVDPILVASHAVVALQSIVSRNVDPEQLAVLTVGRFQGGVRGNIIPNEVLLSGTIRTFDDAVLRKVLRRADEILRGVTSGFGAEYQFDTSTLPAVVNDARCAATVEAAAIGLLGADQVGVARTTGGDDQAYFHHHAPGAYFMLGGGNVARGITWPHHHPKFDFDEDAIPLGLELALRIIETAGGAG